MPNIVWLWLAAFVIFLILELLTPSMIFAGFSIAALISGIFAYFLPDAYYWQIGIFIIASIILLPLTRNFVKRITTEEPSKSNIDALIGKVGRVTKAIDPDLGGQILFEGETWRATSSVPIAVNEKVKILSISGTKVLVEKLT